MKHPLLAPESEALLREQIRKLVRVSIEECSHEPEIARVAAIHRIVNEWFQQALEKGELRKAFDGIESGDDLFEKVMKRVHRLVDEEIALGYSGPRRID